MYTDKKKRIRVRLLTMFSCLHHDSNPNRPSSQGAFRVRPTPKIRQEFRNCTPSGRRGADASNLVPSPQARLSPPPAANAKERRSNEDKKVDGLKTVVRFYLFMFIITSTTF